MNDSPYIIEVTSENFSQVIIEGSRETPVLVDFWAPWCQPCKTLMPTLARLADDYQGKFILAKINTEEEQALAAQFAIRSIPTVKLFKQGEAVDEFMGALPESEIRLFLDRHIPRASDQLVTQVNQLVQAGEQEAAMALIDQAMEEDPDNPRVVLAFARLKATLGDLASAESALQKLPADAQESPEVGGLRARFLFDRIAAEAPDLQTLEGDLASPGTESERNYQLAAHKVMENDFEAALELLLQLMQKDRAYGEDAARKGMLAIFDILGGESDLVSRYRNRMFNVLH